ncbi:alpha/beta fold hydrolase [Kangiella marina]|uniref:Homoserine O-succinyltransferase n=1 Tax=Kangiella marina TaxID=1079178 RepID=A0ABP8IPF1_9GAMM
MTTLSHTTTKDSPQPVTAVLDRIAVTESVRLATGNVIEPFGIEYSVYGSLDKPVIVVLGGISASRNLIDGDKIETEDAAHDARAKGWWDELVGNEKAIDTNEFCVISLNYLGALKLETIDGHSSVFNLTPADQSCILNLLLVSLGIDKAITIVGSSYGGMVGLSYAEQYPEALKKLICISASDKSTHTARAIRSIQRGIFELASNAQEKHQALSLARQLSILFYRTDEIFDTQFTDPVFLQPSKSVVGYEKTIYSYLSHQGEKFANRNTIPRYESLLDSIDSHRVDACKIISECHFIAVPTDRLVSYESMRKLAHKVKGTSHFYRLESIYGHDAFLKECQQLTSLLKKILGENDEPSTSYASC